MDITFGTESDFPAAMFKNFSLRKMSKAWWPLLGPKFWKVPLRPARSNDIFVLVSHAKTYASPPWYTGLEKFLMMGFPIDQCNVGSVSDYVSLAYLMRASDRNFSLTFALPGTRMHVRSIAAAFCCAFQACVWSASWRPFLGNKWQEAGKVLPATWPFVARRWPSASWPLWQTRGMLSNYNQESEFSVRQSFSNSVFPKGCGHEEVWCLLRKKSGLKCEICHHHFDFEAIYCDHVWTYHDLPTSNKVTNHSLGAMREWLNGPAGPTWPASIYSPVRFLGGKSWPIFTIQIMSCKHVLLLIHDLNVEVLEHLELKLPWVGTVLCAHNGAIGGLRSCDENRRWRNQSRAQSQISKGFDLGGISESGILSLLISE